MEYQQFVVYCHWTKYNDHRSPTGRPSEDEAIRRGLSESARAAREVSRADWRRLIERTLTALRFSRRTSDAIAQGSNA